MDKRTSTDPVVSKSNEKRNSDEVKKANARRCSLRSEGAKKLKLSDSISSSMKDNSSKIDSSSLYNFSGDSPITNSSKTITKTKVGRKAEAKTTGSNARSTKTLSASSKVKADSKTSKRLIKEIEDTSGTNSSSNKISSSTITPKSRHTKPILKEIPVEQIELKKRKRKGVDKPVPPFSIDDISPILRGRNSAKTSGAKIQLSQKKKEQEDEKEKQLRKSPRVAKNSSASSSFIKSDDVNNDSGLFLSPRKTMPRFSSGKTSTPADLPAKIKNRKTVVKKEIKKVVKNTSTPNEIKAKPKRDFTHIKENISELSPVPRLETPSPTSDYASMDSFISPSSPDNNDKQSRKRRSSSPVFKLEDYSDERLDLNRSTSKSYTGNKKIKRKYNKTSSKNASKIEEWAEKVNSELEDLENFELSIEG
ncbi:hypothetical protein ACF0H5_002022 [Mactra antiquata]